MRQKREIRLGQLLIQKQICTLRQVSEALQRQAEEAQRGKRRPLGRVLVELRLIDADTLRRVLAELGALVQRCVDCGQRFSFQEFDPDVEYRCRVCSGRLEMIDPDGDETEPVPYHSTKFTSVSANSFDPDLIASESTAKEEGTPRDRFVGRVLGGCRITERIAAGGMGVVYKALQLNLDRVVAVKVLSQDLARDETFVRRFLEEARAAAQLNHGNIVHINDVGESQGVFYFTMEHVDGVTLKEMLDETGSLPVVRTMEIAMQVCAALQHAHQRGIVHRDIKPENIMITRDGIVKLADLGLAKRVSASVAEGITQAGTVFGTPYYMPPEQAKDFSQVDARTDIYSLGVTLFRTMGGEVPFQGRSPIEVMIRVIEGRRRRLSELVDDLPSSVEAIIDRMIQPTPEARYQSVTEIQRDLEAALETLERQQATTS